MKMIGRPLSRRDFVVRSAGALAATAFVGACGDSAQPSTSTADTTAAAGGAVAGVPNGVQLYCVRDLLNQDFPGTIAALADMGYQGVEHIYLYEGYEWPYSAAEIRQILEDNGLRSFGTHLSMGLLTGDQKQETIDYHLELGNPNLIVGSLPGDTRNSKDAVLAAADQLNQLAAELRPHGLRVGYHNHAYTFSETFDGETIWQILADNLDEGVILQLDTGNGASGGADIPTVLQQAPGHVISMHVKPYTASAEEPMDPFIGEDGLDWPQIIQLAESVGGIEYYIIEYEQESHPPLEALAANLENFRQIRSSVA